MLSAGRIAGATRDAGDRVKTAGFGIDHVAHGIKHIVRCVSNADCSAFHHDLNRFKVD
jgi:hypothetical protein